MFESLEVLKVLNSVYKETLNSANEQYQDKKCLLKSDKTAAIFIIRKVDTFTSGEISLYGDMKLGNGNFFLTWIATDKVTKMVEGNMVDSEYEFGKKMGELSSTGDIQYNKDEFIATVEKMRDMLINMWHNEDSELCFNDPDFEKIWEHLKSNPITGEYDLGWVIDGVEAMLSDLNEGDGDDAFGSSGWRDYMGWW